MFTAGAGLIVCGRVAEEKAGAPSRRPSSLGPCATTPHQRSPVFSVHAGVSSSKYAIFSRESSASNRIPSMYPRGREGRSRPRGRPGFPAAGTHAASVPMFCSIPSALGAPCNERLVVIGFGYDSHLIDSLVAGVSTVPFQQYHRCSVLVVGVIGSAHPVVSQPLERASHCATIAPAGRSSPVDRMGDFTADLPPWRSRW